MPRRFHDALKRRENTQAQVDRQREQLGQQPAISDALSLPLVGSVSMWAGAEAPTDNRFLLCDGAEYAIQDEPELYAAIGTTWNDGTETPGYFRVPNIPGRTVVGAGPSADAALTDRLVADIFGQETVTLTTAQMPAHNHNGATNSGGAHDHGGSTASDGAHTHTTFGTKNSDYNRTGTFDAINALTGSSGGQQGSTSSNGNHSHTITNHSGHTHTIDTVGSGSSHTNIQPSVAMHFIIRAKL